MPAKKSVLTKKLRPKKSVTTKKSKSSIKKDTLVVINPATLEQIGELDIDLKPNVESRIEAAKKAQNGWGRRSPEERASELKKLRKCLAENREEMVDTIVRETGKSRMDALMEVFTILESIQYTITTGVKALRRNKRSSGLLVHKSCYVNYHPWGVVGVISPWNYPLILSLTPIINALIAGNAVVIKPSEITPFTTLKVQEFFQRAGLPDGILQVVIGRGETGAALVESAGTNMIFFTGSTATGRIIGEKCGKMLKPVILELGGKDPFIVFSDANLKRAARGALWGGFFNSGQTCISVERVYVQKEALETFTNYIKEEYGKIKQGHNESFPSVGSMTFDKQVQILESHYQDAQKKGARFLYGGKKNEEYEGHYHLPTVVLNSDHSMKIMKDETFGPMISIMEFSTEEEAIQLANDTSYGLNASVWTQDSKKGKRVAEQIQSGSVCINDCLANYMLSDLPFGGFKESGLGRVHGPEGIRAFAQPQSVMRNRWFWNASKEFWWYPYSKTIYNLVSKTMKFLFG